MFSRYDVNLVVADEPHNRHNEITLLERGAGICSARSRAAAKAAGRRDWGILPPTPEELYSSPDAVQTLVSQVQRSQGEPHIERQLVDEVVKRHQAFMSRGPPPFTGYGM